MTPRSWDAASYHKVAGPQERWGLEVLERLALDGDEVVLDAGCGTGRVTRHIVDRVPNGRVIGVDVSESMVAEAGKVLGDAVELHVADLLELALPEPVDAVFSTATFHWILDHDRLFQRVFDVLKPGGQLVAQCGGAGNLASLLDVAAAVNGKPEYALYFENWVRSYMASAEDTAARLERIGFVDVNCWTEPRDELLEDPEEYLRTVNYGAYLERLPHELRDQWFAEIWSLLAKPVTLDYVRLNIDARRSLGIRGGSSWGRTSAS
jgi:trans-aconitate 2-methyltransferase